MIRKATLDDLDKLATMGKEFLDFGPYADRAAELGSDDMRQALKKIMSSDFGRVFVYEVKGRIYGALIAVLSSLWFSRSTTVAAELAWWVDPEMRGSPAAVRLMAAFEAWAADNHADYVVVSDMISRKGEWAAAQLVDRLGYKVCERTHVKELTHASVH